MGMRGCTSALLFAAHLEDHAGVLHSMGKPTTVAVSCLLSCSIPEIVMWIFFNPQSFIGAVL